MKKQNIISTPPHKILSIALLICILFGCSTTEAHANDSSEMKSRGRVVFNNDTEDPSDDVIFEASDLQRLDAMVTGGKSVLATSLNNYPNTNVDTSDTFATLASSIDELTAIPSEKYYYDSTTGISDASALTCYIKEDGLYYPCNNFGIKTSDTVATVNEGNLIEYTSASAENMSMGTAGYVDKTLVLGNGADVMEAYNNGWIEGQKSVVDNLNIQYTYHQHEGDSSVQGGCYTIPDQHTHNNACYTTCTGIQWMEGSDSNGYWHYWKCYSCGWSAQYTTAQYPINGNNGAVCGRKKLTCTESTSLKGYKLGCGKTEETIESALIIY